MKNQKGSLGENVTQASFGKLTTGLACESKYNFLNGSRLSNTVDHPDRQANGKTKIRRFEFSEILEELVLYANYFSQEDINACPAFDINTMSSREDFPAVEDFF
jgi:hypothetical protein